MKSMTGYGKGVAVSEGRSVTIEMRAVNHRFLDLLLKLPRKLAFCEDPIRKLCSKTLKRGHVDVFCTYEDTREGKANIVFDIKVAEQYKNISEELSKLGFVEDMTTSQVLKMPEVLATTQEEDDDEAIKKLILEASEIALNNLVKMRECEGEILKTDLNAKVDELEIIVSKIEEKAPSVAIAHAERLKNRVAEALKGAEIDEARLLTEVAVFTDKVNIDEEITRLKGHIVHARKIFSESGSIGKKLDFLIQEFNREINTTGSKSNDLTLTEFVLKAKNIIEMMREQVQNIE